MRKILLLAVFAAFFLASYPVSAAGGWWNESWHFRAPVNISFSAPAQNASVNASVNFSSILGALGVSGTFYRNSLRVVENNSEIPADFLNATLTAGNVSWIANGSTAANTNRTFYVYFDILENGAKAAGKIISESCNSYGNNTCYWRSGYANNMDVWSNQSASPGLSYEWNKSWASMIEISWKWSTEAGFDTPSLYVDGALLVQKTSGSNCVSGSESIQASGSRISARFKSDLSNTCPTTDSYGTYGTAVDTIKFYPTATVTTPSFTASQGAAQKQYVPALSGVAVSGAGWGETFNYTVNASDPEGDNVSVTLFTLEGGIWNRKTAQTGNGTMLNWTVSPFSCSDIGAINYMFEYNDSSHAPLNSSNYSQTVEKDDIQIEYYSGNASVNREGGENITFGIKLNDTDRRTYVSGQAVNFWSYYSGLWNNLGSNDTVSGGISLQSLDPGCSISAGGNLWKANFSGSCYKTSESSNFVFTALGQIRNYLIQPPPLEYDLGGAVPIEANVTDECENPITGASVNFTVNATGYAAVERGAGKYNYSWDSSAKQTGNYTIQINATKPFYNFNLTSWVNRFRLVAGPPQINASLNASQAAQNSFVRISASVADMSATGIARVWANVTYPNASVAQYNMTNSSGTWQSVLNDTLARGQYNITVYASDNAGKTGNSTNAAKIYARIGVDMNSQNYTLEKDWFGSVYYKARDANASLSGVAVNLSVQRPDGAELMWFSNINSYATNSYGLLNTPTFVIPMGIPPGQYRIDAVSSFNDTLAGVSVSNTTSYNFTLNNVSSPNSSSSGSQSGSAISAKIVMPSVQYVGHDLSFVALFYNSSGFFDPDSVNVTVYQLTSQYASQLWINKTKSEMNRISAGVYGYSQSIASSTATGNYVALLNSSVGGAAPGDATAFEILQGGPFDISITPLQSEVSQGGTLSFDINITNKGPVDRGDSTVTYQIGDGSRYYATTSVFVPARGNVSLRKSFAIFSDESAGVKNLSVKVDYDPFYGPSNASATFLVNAAAAPAQAFAPSGGTGVSGGGAAAAPSVNVSANASNVSAPLRIFDYPKEIEIERGWAKFVTVAVGSADGIVLHNVSISMAGMPEEWFEIQTPAAAQLGGNKSFMLRFFIPDSVKSGNYKAKLRAASAEYSAEKDVILRVFSSKDDLIKYQLETLNERIHYLDALSNQTERDGKDVKSIRDALNDIRLQADNAANLLNRKLYGDASSSIITIRGLLDKVESDLEQLRNEKAEPSLLSWVALGVIGMAAAIIMVFAYLLKRIKGGEKFNMQRFYEIKRMIMGKAAGGGIRSDMEKTQKMIKLIQSEYSEGIISKDTYDELKRTNEEKLLRLGKRLSDLGLKE